jgi:hypothetical protein
MSYYQSKLEICCLSATDPNEIRTIHHRNDVIYQLPGRTSCARRPGTCKYAVLAHQPRHAVSFLPNPPSVRGAAKADC